MLMLSTFLEGLPLWALGVLLFLVFAAAASVGRWLRRRQPEKSDAGDPGLVVSASLGLLALLLGFTVSMAVGRDDARRAAVIQEANAIGTFLYRTDLMPAPLRAQTHQALDRYIAARLQVGRLGERADGVAEAKRITADAQAEMWRDVLAVREAVPDPAVKILIIESANQMFDMATARDAALANRLPYTLLLLLLFFPIASLVLIGYVGGSATGVHLMASTEMIVLLTLVLLLVADLNRPRSGTIVASQVAIEDVKGQLAAARVQPVS